MDLRTAIALAHPVVASGPGSGRHKEIERFLELHDQIKEHPARQGNGAVISHAVVSNYLHKLEDLHGGLSKVLPKKNDNLQTARRWLDVAGEHQDPRPGYAADQALGAMHTELLKARWPYVKKDYGFSASKHILAGPGDILFNPRKQMKAHILAAANQISSHFDQISAAVNRGSGIKSRSEEHTSEL